MTDLSAYSDAEILALAGGGGSTDLSSYSDADILSMAGVQPQIQPETKAGLYDYAMGGLKGIAKAGSDIIATPLDLVYRGGNELADLLLGENKDLTGTYPSDYRNKAIEYISGGEGNDLAEGVTHVGGNLATIIANPSQAKNIANKALPYLSKIPGAGTIATLLGLGAEGAAQSAYMNPKGNLAEDAGIGALLNIGTAGIGKGIGKLWDTFAPTAGSANRGAQVLAGDIAEQFRTVTPDAFSDAITLEDRAGLAARSLNKTARDARNKASALFEALPDEPVILDDAIKNVADFVSKVEGPLQPGGSTSSILKMLQGLKSADEIISTPASTLVDELGKPLIPAVEKVIPGGPAVLPLNKVQNTLRDIGKLQRGASGVDRAVLGLAQDEILQAAEKSVSPSAMKLLQDARGAWGSMINKYEKSAVGTVRKSLLEPGKRLSTLKTKLLNDPKTAEELTAVMSPKELSNVQNLVLMDLTSKAPVSWERAISKQYDSYKHIFGEANTEKLLQMVSREGSIGSKLLKDNNGLGGLLAKTGLKGAIGSTIGYAATGDWEGALLGGSVTAMKGRLEGKVVNQAKSLIMRAAIGSDEALKILNTVPKSSNAYSQGIERLAAAIPAGIRREISQENKTLQSLQPQQTESKSSSNSSTNIIDKAIDKAEKMIDIKIPEGMTRAGGKPVEIIEAKRVSSKVPSDSFVEKEEGGQRLKAYPPPAKGSGVTVSSGVDLGQQSEEGLRKIGVSEKIIFKVKPYLGLKDATARKKLKERPLTITKAEADELDSAMEQEIYGTVETKLKNKGLTLAKLPAEAQAVIKSLSWNFGADVDEDLPTIWKAIIKKDWATVQDLLVNTKWKQPELVARRKREADLLSRIV